MPPVAVTELKIFPKCACGRASTRTLPAARGEAYTAPQISLDVGREEGLEKEKNSRDLRRKGKGLATWRENKGWREGTEWVYG